MEIIPRFFLKVDPAAISKAYDNGHWNVVPVRKPLLSETIAPAVAEVTSHDSEQPVYGVQSRSNLTFLYTTTGHSNLGVWRDSGRTTVPGRCDRCKEDMPDGGIGYPIRYKPEILLVGNSSNSAQGSDAALAATGADEDPTYRIFHVFWVTGMFCDESCALAFLQSTRLTPVNTDSEHLLRKMYSLKYPLGPPLVGSSAYQLLEKNGGALPAFDPNHQYVPTNRVLEVPIREEYLRRELTKTVGAGTIARAVAKEQERARAGI